MNLVTLSVDDHHLLIITFPVFVKVFDRKHFVLYEVKTVPVPTND